MSQALVLSSQGTALSITQDEIQLVKNTIAQGATEAELKLYLYDCQRQGVHPLDRMIHFTKRKSGDEYKYAPVISIDFLRARAESTGEYAGNDDPVFDDEKNPRKATVTVYKIVAGQRVPFTASARWDQYYPGERAGYMWKKMPHLMLGKCAEALALRKAFPKQFAGLYTHEEMQQAENKFPSGVIETKGHAKISSPSVPQVSLIKEGRGGNQTNAQIVHEKVVEQAKTILGAKIISEKQLSPEDPESASLLSQEPSINTEEGLQVPEPSQNILEDVPTFGDPKPKKGPYFEVVNEKIHVYNSYMIKDKLKRNGFNWDAASKTWTKAYTKFDTDALEMMISGKEAAVAAKIMTSPVEDDYPFK